MRNTFSAAVLLAILTVSELATARPQTAAAALPAGPGIEEWHRDIVARYKQVVYLDLAGQSVAADAFLAVLAERKTSLTMTVVHPDQGAIMTLRLIPTPAPR